MWVLKRFNLIRRLSREDLGQLRDLSSAHALAVNQLLPCDAVEEAVFYWVDEGRVKLARFDADGREILAAVVEEGEAFGLPARRVAVPARAYAEALQPSRVRRCSESALDRLLEERSSLRRALDASDASQWLGRAEIR